MPSGFLLLRRLALALASCLGSLCFLGFLSLGSIPLVAFGLPFAIAFAATITIAIAVAIAVANTVAIAATVALGIAFGLH